MGNLAIRLLFDWRSRVLRVNRKWTRCVRGKLLVPGKRSAKHVWPEAASVPCPRYFRFVRLLTADVTSWSVLHSPPHPLLPPHPNSVHNPINTDGGGVCGGGGSSFSTERTCRWVTRAKSYSLFPVLFPRSRGLRPSSTAPPVCPNSKRMECRRARPNYVRVKPQSKPTLKSSLTY